MLPGDLACELYAHTGGGHIQFDMPVTVSGSIERTRVRGKLNGGGGPLLEMRMLGFASRTQQQTEVS